MLVLAAGPVQAEMIVARSGEHSNFSRIVLPFPEGAKWSMGRADFGYEVLFEDKTHQIDFTRVFDLMPKSRVTDIRFSAIEGRLRLYLDCACHADAFDYNGGKLVLDIKDGPPSEDARFEGFIKSEITVEKTAGGGPVSFLKQDSEIGLDVPKVTPSSKQTSKSSDAKRHARNLAVSGGLGSMGSLMRTTATEALDANLFVDSNAGDRATEGVELMENNLLLQIGRAASQGLLSPRRVLERGPSFSPIVKSTKSVQSNETPTVSQTPRVRLSARTSIDESLRSVFESGIESLNVAMPTGCLDEEFFDINSWGDEAKILGSISDARRQLFTEFDNAKKKNVIILVKAYLYAGFGSEAKSAIMSLGLPARESQLLLEMSEVVEFNSLPRTSLLASQSECDTAGAMWAVLAQPEIAKDMINVPLPAILSAFSSLPIHLRQHLGPELIESFLAADEPDTAVVLRNAIGRAGGVSGDVFGLIDAKIKLEQGQIQPAEEQLENVANSNSVSSLGALILLVNHQIQGGKKISPEIFDALEGFAHEYRKSPEEAEILGVIIRAFARNGDFESAFNSTESAVERGALSPQMANDLKLYLIDEAVEALQGINLVSLYFSQEKLIKTIPLPIQIQQELARVLIANGFPAAVEDILGIGSPRDAKDAIILAELALLGGSPLEALELTSEFPNLQKAIEIRIRSANMLGDNGLAAREYSRLGDDEARNLAHWRDRDFLSLAGRPKNQFSNVAQILIDENKPAQPDSRLKNTLTDYRQKLNESRDLRTAFDEVVSNLDSPE